MKFNIKALALTCGIFWAASVLLMGLFAAYFGWCTAFVDLIANAYIGYGPTLAGAIIGTIWAFVDATFCGAIFAWLYNRLAGKK